MIIVSASEAADFIVYIRGWSEARAACRTPPPFLGRGLVVLGVLAAVHGWTLFFGPSVGELPETQTECVATTSHFATASHVALFVFRAQGNKYDDVAREESPSTGRRAHGGLEISQMWRRKLYSTYVTVGLSPRLNCPVRPQGKASSQGVTFWFWVGGRRRMRLEQNARVKWAKE